MAASASFKALADATYAKPRVRFKFDDVNYSDYVLKIGQISRDTEVTAGNVNIDVVNTDQTFNILSSTPTKLGNYAQVELYFPGLSEYESLFKGTLEKAIFNTDGTVTLQCRDRMATMLEKPIGYGTAPVTFAATGPASLVWDILTNTNYGELNSGTTTGNPDIDYTSWTNWRTSMNSQSFKLAARSAGASIRELLQLIADLTNSLIWVNGDGKFDFQWSFYSNDRLFTRSNCLAISRDIEEESLANTVGAGYGYDTDTGFWAGLTSSSSVSSQDDYGKKAVYFENKTVWHATSTSASNFCTGYLALHDAPIEHIYLTSTLYGYTAYIGGDVRVTDSLLDISTASLRIEEIDGIDVNKGLIYLSGRLI